MENINMKYQDLSYFES